MSIRFRLILSNIAMILVPVILFILAAFLLTLVFKGDLREIGLFPDKSNHHASPNKEARILIDLRKQLVINPKQILNKDGLNALDKQLQTINAKLIVRKGESIYYHSADLTEFNPEDLPEFGSNDPRNFQRVDHNLISLQQIDFIYPDGDKGSFFIIQDVGPLVDFAHTFFPILLGILLLILILTNGLLTYLVSKSIIKPVNYLKKAAEEIKDGNLDFEIKKTGQDEIGQLSQAFEEMRKRLQESISIQLQYEENRKELITNISHDLKTPIASIKGYIEGIQDGVANSPEKVERYMKTIHNKANEMDNLIDELFLYSKLDLRRLPFNFEVIEIESFLKSFIEELSFELEKEDITVTFAKLGISKTIVIADREKLKRVVSNIINNSLKYMDKQLKRIDITLVSTEKDVTVLIKDNGPGIPLESLPHIFDRFYRADQSRNSSTGGSGLGLAIAKKIIEEHNGTIKALSEPDNGTAISFTLNKAEEISDEGETNEKNSYY